MTQSQTGGKIVAAVFRYTALAFLVAAFAIAAPLWGLARELVNGLTNEATYVQIVKDFGIGRLATGTILEISSFLPENILKYLDDGQPGSDGQPSSLQRLNDELGKAVDTTVAQVASQIPSYIAGKSDNISGGLSLLNLKSEANKIAAEKAAVLPIGGSFVEGLIKEGVNKAIPDQYSLDKPLDALEASLTPIRTSVSGLINFIDTIGGFCVLALFWIVLISFNILRAARWVGFALLTAGILGAAVGGTLSGLLGLTIPNVVLENAIFQNLLSSSVDRYRDTAVLWIIGGVPLVAFSFALPPFSRFLGRRLAGNRFSHMVVFLTGRHGGLTLAVALALPFSFLAFLLTRGHTSRKAAASALGGLATSAILMDCLLPALVIGGLSGGGQPGWIARIVAVPIWILFVLFWVLRDRPKTLGGFNFVDRIAGIRRGRMPGHNAPVASLLRSLPLIGGMIACVFVPAPVAFAGVALVEITAHLLLWPDRTLGDLIAGTRARLLINR